MNMEPVRLLLLIGIALLTTAGELSCAQTFSYTITLPKLLYRTRPAHIFVYMPKPPLSLTLNVHSVSSKQLLVREKHEISQAISQLTLKLPPTPVTAAVELQFTLIKCPDSSACYKPVTKNVSLAVIDEPLVIFVESNKPIYKPGDLVRFRLVPVNGITLRPPAQTGFSLVYVESPDKRRMSQWTGLEWVRAFKGLEFRLSADPVYGSWSIVANLGAEGGRAATQQKHTFLVEKYVMPKFSLTIQPPKQVTLIQPRIIYSLCAVYGTGKPIAAKLTTSICLRRGIQINNVLPCAKGVARLDGKTSKCAQFDFDTEFYRNFTGRRYYHRLWISGEAEEEGTGEVLRKSLQLGQIQTSPMKMAIIGPQIYRRGLPYYAELRTTNHDGSPYPYANVSCSSASLKRWSDSNRVLQTDSGGRLLLTVFPFPKTSSYMSIRCTTVGYIDETSPSFFNRITEAAAYKSMNLLYSESYIYLQILPPTRLIRDSATSGGGDDPCTSGDLTLVLESNNQLHFAQIFVQIMSRGVVDRVRVYKPIMWAPHPTLTGVFTRSLRLNLTSVQFIDARVTVFANRNGQILVDWTTVRQFELCLTRPNYVRTSFGFSRRSIGPGRKVLAQIKRPKGDAKCALRISDVNLKQLGSFGNVEIGGLIGRLRKANSDAANYYDINRGVNPTLDIIRQFCGMESVYWNKYALAKDIVSFFHNAGLLLLTDASIVRESACYSVRYRMMAMAYHDGGSSVSNPFDTVTPVRENFPETWIFDYLENPNASLALTTPDSMTTWDAHFYCLTSEGLHVAPPTSLTVISPFFLQLTLPYSLIRGEVALIPVKLFNYLPNCYEIDLRADGGTGLKLRGQSAVKLCLCDYEQKVVSFKVEGTLLGTHHLMVTATSKSTNFCYDKVRPFNAQHVGDAVRRAILVEPEGIPEEDTRGDLICLDGTNLKSKTLTLQSQLPDPVIPDSARGYAIWTGDIMGPSLSNLDRLVRMPYGCGEQNMVTMVPSIYVLDYFLAMQIQMPQVESKARQYIAQGYQRQLKYRRADGSFSAFGSSDKKGSTWLTAFVVRSFIQAEKYTKVDNGVLKSAMRFLIGKQNAAGCFAEDGRVIHLAMKGVSGSNEATLTAYVLSALLKSNSSLLASRHSFISRAIGCIEKHTPVNMETLDIGSLALRTYVLGINSSNDPQLFKRYYDAVLLRSKSENGLVYWPVPRKLAAPPRYRFHRPVSSAEVETTSYALLATMNKRPATESLKVIRWLSQKQNAHGGWSSTQDTVVGLFALSSMARKLQIQDNTSMTLSVKSSQGNFAYSGTVDSVTRLLTWKLAVSVPNSLTFTLTGKGCLVAQLSTLFNVPKPESPEPVFNVSVEKEMGNGTGALKSCIVYSGVAETVSNMVVLEMKMLTGWQPQKASLDSLRASISENGLKRLDVADTKLDFYFDPLSTGEGRCVNVLIEQKIVVEKPRSARTRVYDYYQPEFTAETSYDGPAPVSLATGSGVSLPSGGNSEGLCHLATSGPLTLKDQIRLLKTTCSSPAHLVMAKRLSGNLGWEFKMPDGGMILEWNNSLSIPPRKFACLTKLEVGHSIVIIAPAPAGGTSTKLVGQPFSLQPGMSVVAVSLAKTHLSPMRAAVCEVQGPLYTTLLRLTADDPAEQLPGPADCLYCSAKIPTDLPKDGLCHTIPKVVVSYRSPANKWFLRDPPPAVPVHLAIPPRCQCSLKALSSNYSKSLVLLTRKQRKLTPRSGSLQLDHSFLLTTEDHFKEYCGI